jgi:lipid-A-disaccharide synthase
MKIGIVAGETSGDILGQDLMLALLKINPDIEFIGVGGELMQSAGLNSFFPIERLSVMGIVPILKRLPELLKRRKKLAHHLIDSKVDVFIGIDAPEFNLGLEKKLKDSGINTVHYVSPSVWAWREKRIFKIKKSVDLMLTLLPFEKAIYDKHDIPVLFVGHPLAKQIKVLDIEQNNLEKRACRHQLSSPDLEIPEEGKIITVMPGSRGSELKYIGPVFAESIRKIQKKYPDCQILVPCANQKLLEQWLEICEHYSIKNMKVLLGQSRTCMRAADLVLLASGTATLEGLLINRSMVVGYKLSKFSYAIFKRLLTINFFSLPNLLLGKAVVPELIQERCNSQEICKAVTFELEKPHSLYERFHQVHKELACDSGDIAAKAILDIVEKKAMLVEENL